MTFDDSLNNRSRFFSFLILLGDVVLLNIVMYLCRTIQADILSPEEPLVQTYCISTLAYLFAAGTKSVILHHRKVRAYQIISKVSRNMLLYTVFLFIIFYPGQRVDLYTNEFITFILSSFVTITLYRLSLRELVKASRRKGNNLRHIVIVGAKYNTAKLYKELTEDRSTGYRVHGYFADEPSDLFPAECAYLGKPTETIAWLQEHPFVQQLYCNLPSAQKDVIRPLISYCENHLVHFYSVPNLYNYHHHRVFFNVMGSVPYLSLRQNPLDKTENRFLKRAFDILFSSLFLCTLFPIVLLIVTIITKITMPGPVFFKQKRNGLNDEEFYCYKFRSMKVNKDADKLQATKNDPRKTKWGNIMRKTSLDELPQFINVFKGEMSVVGPRPHMVKHTEEYSQLIDKYMVRHFVKPGITGWAQVTGFRGETKELKDMEGRIQGDIWYIEHWNLWLDLYIIYKTVANAIHGEKNAY